MILVMYFFTAKMNLHSHNGQTKDAAQ